jgi:hypothetical protein
MNAWKERFIWLLGHNTVYLFIRVTEPIVYMGIGYLLGKAFA